MPLSDQLGMEMVVDMLFNLLTTLPRLKGENFIQFDLMRKPRVTFTSTWESSPARISEGAIFATSVVKVTVMTCPTQQRWFGLFMQGVENSMGYVSCRNQPLGPGIVAKILDMIKWEIEDLNGRIQGDFVKYGAAVALATCASLRGPEVFLLDLARLWEYIDIGQQGTIPRDPMKTGTDLMDALHIVATLIGKFKG